MRYSQSIALFTISIYGINDHTSHPDCADLYLGRQCSLQESDR